jgi:hypothetical protein
MKSKWFVSLATAIVLVLALLPAWADHDDDQKFPRNATFTTLITTPRAQGEFVLARNLKFVKEVSRLVDIQPRIVYNRYRLHDGGTSNLEP